MAKCTFLYFSSASTCLLFICGLICHAYLYWNCRLISQPLIIQMSIENIDHRLMLASSESVSDTRSYQMNSRNSRVPSLNSPNVPALPQTKPRAAQHCTLHTQTNNFHTSGHSLVIHTLNHVYYPYASKQRSIFNRARIQASSPVDFLP